MGTLMTTHAKPRRDKRHSTRERVIASGLATATCVGLVGLIGFRTLDQSAQAATDNGNNGSGVTTDQLIQYQVTLDQRSVQLQQYQQQLDQYRQQLSQVAAQLQSGQPVSTVAAAPALAPAKKQKKKTPALTAPAAPRVQVAPVAPAAAPQPAPQTRTGGSKG